MMRRNKSGVAAVAVLLCVLLLLLLLAEDARAQYPLLPPEDQYSLAFTLNYAPSQYYWPGVGLDPLSLATSPVFYYPPEPAPFFRFRQQSTSTTSSSPLRFSTQSPSASGETSRLPLRQKQQQEQPQKAGGSAAGAMRFYEPGQPVGPAKLVLLPHWLERNSVIPKVHLSDVLTRTPRTPFAPGHDFGYLMPAEFGFRYQPFAAHVFSTRPGSRYPYYYASGLTPVVASQLPSNFVPVTV